MAPKVKLRTLAEEMRLSNETMASLEICFRADALPVARSIMLVNIGNLRDAKAITAKRARSWARRLGRKDGPDLRHYASRTPKA